MSRLVSFLVALSMAATLAACGEGTDDTAAGGAGDATETTQVASDETEGDEMTDEAADESVDAESLPLSGEVVFESEAVEAGSQLVFSVNDMTKSAVDAALVTQETIELEDGTSPVPFEISVARADFEPNLRYSLRAQIFSASGEPLLTTNTIYWIDPELDTNELGTLELVDAN